MQNNDLATKLDLLDLKASTKQDLLDVVEKMEERLATLIRDVSDRQLASQSELEARLNQRIDEKTERVETSLLTEFHKWGHTAEAKFRILPVIEERLTILEERISAIERGEAPPKPH